MRKYLAWRGELAGVAYFQIPYRRFPNRTAAGTHGKSKRIPGFHGGVCLDLDLLGFCAV